SVKPLATAWMLVALSAARTLLTFAISHSVSRVSTTGEYFASMRAETGVDRVRTVKSPGRSCSARKFFSLSAFCDWRFWTWRRLLSGWDEKLMPERVTICPGFASRRARNFSLRECDMCCVSFVVGGLLPWYYRTLLSRACT